MQQLRDLRIRTACDQCASKCCSQPYDWVYLTLREIEALEVASGLERKSFVEEQLNSATGYRFRTLNLPCQFLDKETGRCNVYEARPLVCRIFPFYPEPLTGHATLLPVQCGENLHFLEMESKNGWRLADFDDDLRLWLIELWDEAKSEK
jgi:Fe-S-cluster containining protein